MTDGGPAGRRSSIPTIPTPTAQFAGGVGGTAWLFSRPEWVGELDHLFVDEAGQVSLGNLVAMSRSADNIILLGDKCSWSSRSRGAIPARPGSPR